MEHLPHVATAEKLRFTPTVVDALLFPFPHSSIVLSRPSVVNSSISSSSSTFHLQRSVLGFTSKSFISSGICYATNPGSPLPESDPPPGKHLNTTSDLGATFSKVQDRMQIFFAVLFWMSLFFWNCARDDGSEDGPNVNSRFRK